MSQAEPTLASRRDASWWNSPGRAERYYIVVLKPGRSLRVAACGLQSVLNEYDEVYAESVPPGERCQRVGCAQRWQKAGP